MRLNKKYKGVIVPMVTPLNEDFSIDHEATRRILESFIQVGAAPFLLGTTGESVSFSSKQKAEFVKIASECINGREKLYVGISGNSLLESIEEALLYSDYGADALVAHLPFYYPISDSQMLKYYEQLANSVPKPLFLYNNPITTNISIPLNIIDQLSYHPNIVGLKDSERGMERLDEAIDLWRERVDFVHLVGWAVKSSYALLKGSDGIVPSTGNITPGLYKDLYEAAINGDKEKSESIQEKTNRISEIYQKGRNLSQSLPALKAMMSFYGLCQQYVMPPMYKLEKEELGKIKEATATQMGELI